MEEPRLPAPRRAPRFRRSGPAAPPPAPEPRVADLSALLADIDALRTTLSTDLSLAAAAVESGADDLAAELVGHDLDAVHAFETRALGHLAALGERASLPAAAVPAATPVAATAGGAVAAPAAVVPLRRRRVLAGAPLVAAAAAVVGLFAGVVPDLTRSPAPTTTVDGLSEAGYSLAMLSDLAERGASTDELRAAARQLNDEVADLLADAEKDPLAARQALMLLNAGTIVLTEQDDQGALRSVLARTRELEAVLRRVLPAAPAPSTVLPPLPAVAPTTVVVRPPSEKPSTRPSSTPTSRPTATPTPTTTPSPAPTSTPTATPTPAPSASTTPAPSPTPPFGNPFDPAGFPDY